jgi:hypothetical protein
MKTKRDYIAEAFQIWCKIYNQPGDDWSVYYERGHWYGMTRRTESNGYDTTPLAKYVIHFKVDGDTADFYANKIVSYEH